jgi:hypothetical protein
MSVNFLCFKSKSNNEVVDKKKELHNQHNNRKSAISAISFRVDADANSVPVQKKPNILKKFLSIENLVPNKKATNKYTLNNSVNGTLTKTQSNSAGFNNISYNNEFEDNFSYLSSNRSLKTLSKSQLIVSPSEFNDENLRKIMVRILLLL